VQDSLNNWVEGWEVVDKFSDTTDDDGVTTSKADNEAAFTASELAKVAAADREKRDGLLAATDFYALSDVVMTSAMTTYRQSLRDITSQSEWPTTITWPTAP
jgi:hypothetical protein